MSYFNKDSLFTTVTCNMKFFSIFIWGFASAIPISSLYTTLPAWMIEQGFSFTTIGIFSVSRFPYAVKFLWSGLVDRWKIPFLFNICGQRRSWMILAHFGILTALLLINLIGGIDNFLSLTISGILFGLFGSIFDIAYEAHRIEIINKEEHALAIATSVFGYRFGLTLTGAASLFLAQYSWLYCFSFIGSMIFFSILFSFSVSLSQDISINILKEQTPVKSTKKIFQEIINSQLSFIIISTIILYRVGEAVLGTMLIPFFIDLGFSKSDIASILNIIGLIATSSGAYFGAIITSRHGIFWSLFICGIPQMLSNLSFIFLNYLPHDILYLSLAVIIENFTAGMGTTALVSYLCFLSNGRNTAIKFAIFSALAAFANNTVPIFAGKIVDIYGWDIFFIFSTLIALPGVILSYILIKSDNITSSS